MMRKKVEGKTRTNIERNNIQQLYQRFLIKKDSKLRLNLRVLHSIVRFIMDKSDMLHTYMRREWIVILRESRSMWTVTFYRLSWWCYLIAGDQSNQHDNDGLCFMTVSRGWLRRVQVYIDERRMAIKFELSLKLKFKVLVWLSLDAKN
jgi:hypothetical protein